MTLQRDIKDIRRFSTGTYGEKEFMGRHDYGSLSVPWDKITSLYMLNLQKKDEKTDQPFLIFTVQAEQAVHLIPARHFNYREFFSGKPPSDIKSTDDPFRALVELFTRNCAACYKDISVRDFLKGGFSFVPKVKNIWEILEYRETVEGHEKEEESFKEEEKEDTVKLKVWTPGEFIEERYEVLKLFKGGMGVVYIVKDVESSQPYAVKMFQEQFLWDKKVNEMFFHEAQIWIELEKHENIVRAYFVKTIQGCPALFLEYIDGGDLEGYLQEGALEVEAALSFAIQFCAGMAYAHEKMGIVHRDIKPANCLIDRDLTLKITDFGLGKILDPEEGEGKAASKAADDEETQGTFAYMAPESFKAGGKIDTRADIYSFGIMLYEMLTGQKPIPGNDMMEYMKNHATYIAPPPGDISPDVPADLEIVVMRCLQKNPAMRYGSFREVEQALQLIFREVTGTEMEAEQAATELTAEEWGNKALSLAALGRHNDALKPFDRALEQMPENAALWAKKGESLAALSLHNEAIQCFDKSLLIDHRLAPTWISRGNSLFLLRDYEKALFCYDNALKVDPENAEVWAKKGAYYNLIGSQQEALECLNRALASNPRLGDAWYEKGLCHIAAEEFHVALECTIKALELNPLSKDAWFLKASITYQLRDYEAAIESFSKVMEMDPHDMRAPMGKADSQFLLGKFHDALATLDKFLALDAANDEALEAKGDNLFILGEKEEALRCYELILARSPRHGGALYKKGIILQELYYFDEAGKCMEDAFLARPGDRLIAYYRSAFRQNVVMLHKAVEREREQLGKAVADLFATASEFSIQVEEEKKGLLGMFKKKESEVPEDLRARAVEALQKEDYDNALRNFARYLRIRGNDSGAWEQAAEILAKHENLPAAAMCYKKALTYSSTVAGTWEKLFKILRALPGTRSEALACVQHLISLAPEDMTLKIRELALMEEIGLACLIQLKAHSLLNGLDGLEETTQILKYRGILMALLGRLKDAVKIFDSALKKDQKDIFCLIQKGDALARMGERQAALKCFMTASKYRPQEAQIFFYQGITHEDLNDLEKAVKCYDLALKNRPDYELPLIKKGFCLYKSGQGNEALEYYNKVLESNPDSANAWEAKGLVMCFQRRFNEAKWCFEKALEIEGARVSTLKNLALLLYRLESYKDAVTTITRLLALDSLQEEALSLKALCHFMQNEPEEALASCELIHEVSPRNVNGWINKGYLLDRLRRPQEALACFERAIELSYKTPEAFINKGIILCKVGRFEDAIADLKIALSLDSKNAFTWYNMALWYARKGKFEDSLNAFDTSIACDYTLIDAWIDRGITQYFLKFHDEAFVMGEKAAEINAKYHKAWFLQGLALAGQEKHGNAIKFFNRCLGLKHDYTPGYIARALSLEQLERKDEAAKDLDKTIELLEEEARLTGKTVSNEDIRNLMTLNGLLGSPRTIAMEFDFSIQQAGLIVAE
ncbi:MAG: tetratricopeptide repeat protein [Candidatus Eremiobacteraeota bacterium]|nr:tetratricopeptide repeat protein [Candidatus Eremiobacteraeota bacterium]